MPSAEMPEPGQISALKATALAGLAPIGHDSRALHGKRAIGGGGRLVRHVLFQAAQEAGKHNSALKAFAEKLRNKGKPHKVVNIASFRPRKLHGRGDLSPHVTSFFGAVRGVAFNETMSRVRLRHLANAADARTLHDMP